MTALVEDIERCLEAGWSDGLPVIPPYAALVDAMLEALGFGAGEVVGAFPEQSIEVRGEHVAAAAVMAGCKREYAVLLRPLALALLDPAFNLTGVEVTTGGVAATVVVSGPVVTALGFEHGANALGAACRANATVGRFAALVRLFCGRGGGVLEPHGTIGHPGRLGFCIAESPSTAWGSFHTQLAPPIAGARAAVTVAATEGPISVNNHYAMTGAAILDTIADVVACFGSTQWYYRNGGYLVVLAPDHMALVARDFTRAAARDHLYRTAVRPTDELIRVGRIPRDPLPRAEVVPGTMRSPVTSPEQFHFIEAGKEGGKFSAVIPRWTGNPQLVSRSVEER